MLPAATSAQRNYTHGARCEIRRRGSRNQPFWEWAGWWEWMEHHLPVHPGVTSLSHSPHNDPGQAGSRQAMLQRLRGIRVHDVPRHRPVTTCAASVLGTRTPLDGEAPCDLGQRDLKTEKTQMIS